MNSKDLETNIKSIPKLLRIIANGTQAKENKHDTVLNSAAELIELLASYRAIAISQMKQL